MRLLVHLLIAILWVLSLPGCSGKENTPPAKAARISATKAYEAYFGTAPTTNQGTCYAFLIYFPAATEAGKVVPFPFFTFDEATIKKVALQRLIGGMDEKSYGGQLLQLFPRGTRLLSLTERDGEATAEFSKELQAVAGDEAKAAALYNAVSLTLAQFPGVTLTRVRSEGKDLTHAGGKPPAEATAVVQPSAPRLLKVLAFREKGAPVPTEVDALFDRPVQIGKFQFGMEDGTPIAGDVYHSMFDMAAVLKPKEPQKLKNVTRLRVRWDVTDRKGRNASGDTVLPLEAKVQDRNP